MNQGAHEQLPSSSATFRFGKRSSTPPPHRHAVTNWIPQRLAERVPQHQPVEDLEPEVGCQVRLAAAMERQRHAQALDLGPERVVGAVVPGAAVDAAGGGRWT